MLDSNVLSSNLSLGRDVVITLRVVNDLSLNGDILNSLIDTLDGFLNHHGLLDFSTDVLDLSLNGIVVSDGSLIGNSLIADNLLVLDDLSLNWDLVDLLDLLILNVLLLERNILDSALNWDLLSNGLVDSTLSVSSSGSIGLLGTSANDIVSGSSSNGIGIGTSINGIGGSGSWARGIDSLLGGIVGLGRSGVEIAGGGVANNWGIVGGSG